MNLLYLIKQPLTPRDWDRFGIGFMLEKGHLVTVLDMSDVIHPGLPNDRSEVVRDERVDVREIKSWDKFNQQRQTFQDSDLVIFLIQSYGLSRSTYRPLRMIAKTGVPYLILAPTLYPGWNIKTGAFSLSGRISDLWARLRNMDPLNSLISRLPPSWLGIVMASYIVNTSKVGSRPNSLAGPRTKAIKAHTNDYEIYLGELKRNPRTFERAVFLDQFLPYHVDFQELNADPVNDQEYFGGLKRLFERIENELGLEVVIAAHPRANYRNRQDVFGGRQVISGQTVHLIATSRLTIAHTSTAIGLAALFEKPVMILATQALYHRQVYDKYYYEAFAAELGTPVRFFDDPELVDLSNVYALNDDLYDCYRKTYFQCPGAAEKPFWEIVLDNIAANHDR